MRTTLTLDDDVAALLDEVRRCKGLGLKEAVNEGLRNGLHLMSKPASPRKPFKVRSLPIGRLPLSNVDDIAEVLAYLEGDNYK